MPIACGHSASHLLHRFGAVPPIPGRFQPNAGEFFLLVYQNKRHGGRSWGFIEVAEKSSVGNSLDDYAARLIRANLGNFAQWDDSDGSDKLKFASVVRGSDIKFDPEDEDFGADKRACGEVVNHQGGARFTISLPGERRPSACAAPEKAIVIDLDNEDEPKRYGRGMDLEPLFRGDHP